MEQGHYGHRARKATWLYAVTGNFPDLRWGPSTGIRMDAGFHSAEERAAATSRGEAKVAQRLTETERIGTPPEFADLLIGLASGSREVPTGQ